jgi:hypothetical protein
MLLRKDRNLNVLPLSDDEHQFAVLLFLQLKATYEAANDGMAIYKPGLTRDISDLLAIPGLRIAWQTIRNFFEPEFVVFVESCRRA